MEVSGLAVASLITCMRIKLPIAEGSVPHLERPQRLRASVPTAAGAHGLLIPLYAFLSVVPGFRLVSRCIPKQSISFKVEHIRDHSREAKPCYNSVVNKQSKRCACRPALSKLKLGCEQCARHRLAVEQCARHRLAVARSGIRTL
eukprot:6174086-Pleurochrysis_carterae.AAC.4